jgi:DNA-binding transcriptional ArsR family regulator
MLKFTDPVDARFAALADGTRRAIVDRLSHGPATVSEIAGPFSITLAAVVQHVGVLEACGLVTTQKSGRVRTCRLEPAALASGEDWLHERRIFWTRRLDRLESVLAAETAAESGTGVGHDVPPSAQPLQEDPS